MFAIGDRLRPPASPSRRTAPAVKIENTAELWFRLPRYRDGTLVFRRSSALNATRHTGIITPHGPARFCFLFERLGRVNPFVFRRGMLISLSALAAHHLG
jgi:hypothetical protein